MAVLRRVVVVAVALMLVACGGGGGAPADAPSATAPAPTTPATEAATEAATAAPSEAPTEAAAEGAPDPTQLDPSASVVGAVARVALTGDIKDRDGTYDVVGGDVGFGGCVDRDVSHEDSLEVAPRELFGLAEDPELAKDKTALMSVQIVTSLPEGDGTLTDVPVSLSAPFGKDDGSNDDYISFTNMPGWDPVGDPKATVVRAGDRVDVTITGTDPEGGEVQAAFACTLQE